MFWFALTEFQSTSSVWRTTPYAPPCRAGHDYFNPRPPCGGRRSRPCHGPERRHFNPRPPCGGRQQKQRKISICIHYNTAICTDLQPKQSAYAFVCTDKDKQSPEKLVRSIRVRSARFTFARPSPPGEALRKSARHPDGRRGELRCVQPCFDNGCPAGKSAGCPLPGRSIWPVRP